VHLLPSGELLGGCGCHLLFHMHELHRGHLLGVCRSLGLFHVHGLPSGELLAGCRSLLVPALRHQLLCGRGVSGSVRDGG